MPDPMSVEEVIAWHESKAREFDWESRQCAGGPESHYGASYLARAAEHHSMAATVRNAVAAEREACALTCEMAGKEWGAVGETALTHGARAIHSRTPKAGDNE